MTKPSGPELALKSAVVALKKHQREFALVGGLAVSLRAEVRFTRDVDLAVVVDDDADAERLVQTLASDGYRPLATVEHETVRRLSTVRLMSPEGVKVDLLFASSGIEDEIVSRAETIRDLYEGVPVARPEELLAMKVLSMSDVRLQDRIDAQNLLRFNEELELDQVRHSFELIRGRGFDRGEDLERKLASVLNSLK